MKGVVVLLAILLAAMTAGIEMAAARHAAAVDAKRARTAHRARPRTPLRHSPSVAIPQELAPPQEAFASFPQEAAESTAARPPSECDRRLAKLAEFRLLPVLIGPGECGAADAVVLQAVILSDRTKVAVSPPATLRCTMAQEVVRWLREDVARAADKFGAGLRAIEDEGSYECRGRNRVHAAMMSEHARANALDVRALKLANDKVIGLTDVNVPMAWRENLRESACARFTTVLGPGSDAYHEEHVHLDLEQRRGGYRLCEWDVRRPAPSAKEVAEKSAPTASPIAAPVPLPRPRPRLRAAPPPLRAAPPPRLWSATRRARAR